MARLQTNANIYSDGQSRATTALFEGVLTVDLHGVHTCESACAALLNGLATHGQAHAFCLMAEKALLAVGDDCLLRINQSDFPRMYGAVVVSDALHDVMESHARQIARQGVVRVVFTERDVALAWAAKQALLAVAQAAWAGARCSS